MIAAITREHGLLHYKCTGKSVNKEKFTDFVKELRNKIGTRPATLFMDNLKVHQTHLVRNECKTQGFKLIYNVAYSPQYMPIEFVFS